MSMRCHICGSSNIRLSRFRMVDIAELLILKYPVRCRTCRERSYEFVLRLIGMKRRAAPQKA
jgi:hypothetical protein